MSTSTLNSAVRIRGRVAAISSALFAACLFLTVASINVPGDASDAELLAWWQDAGNRTSGLVSAAFAVIAAVLLAVVMNHLRSTPAAAAAPAWAGFARSMGSAFTATLLVSAAFRGVIGHHVDALDQPVPDIDVLRYSTALNYLLLDLPVMSVLALTMIAVSVMVLRTEALAKWVGMVGLACAAVLVAAVIARVGAYAIPAALLWALCLAVAIWRAPEDEPTP